MSEPSASSTNFPFETPATTGSTGFTFGGKTALTTASGFSFGSSATTTSTNFSFGVPNNAPSTNLRCSAPTSLNPLRKKHTERRFPLVFNTATTVTAGYSFSTTAVSSTSALGGFSFVAPASTNAPSEFSFGTTVASANTSRGGLGFAAPAGINAPSKFSFGTTVASANTSSSGFNFSAPASTNAPSEFSFGNTQRSTIFGGSEPTMAATTTSATSTIPSFGTLVTNSNTYPVLTNIAVVQSAPETSFSPFGGVVTTAQAMPTLFQLPTSTTLSSGFNFRTTTSFFGFSSSGTACSCITTTATLFTPTFGIASTSTAIPTFSSLSTSQISSALPFGNLHKQLPSQAATGGFQFGTLPKTASTSTLPSTGLSLILKPAASTVESDGFQFQIPASTSSGCGYDTSASNSTWPRGGELCSEPSSSENEKFSWDIKHFLEKCWKERQKLKASDKKLKSVDFSFAGATWNLFISVDQEEFKCQFGVNIRGPALDTESECDCDISVISRTYSNIKNIKHKFKFESSDFHWTVEDFLDSELDEFLHWGIRIRCRISIKRGCSQTKITHSALSSDTESIDAQLLEKDSLSFPDATWPRCGNLERRHHSAWMIDVHWHIFYSSLAECLKKCKEWKSDDFSFGDATFNFFASFDGRNSRSLFGMNVRTPISTDEEFDCCFDIASKHFKCKFQCEKADSHWRVTDFLSESELDEFLHSFSLFNCKITRKRSVYNDASSQTITYSTENSAAEVLIQTQHLENDEDGENENPEVKVLQDFKNLLLTGEGTDVTILVKEKEFKAHRSVLVARSSVFASMFRHNMKENATGAVDIEDCDPLFFPVLLEFIYCGTTDKISVENVFSLYTSADKYDLLDLKRKCLKFIKKNLSVDTFCETVRLSLQHSETNLLKFTLDYFAKHMKEIVSTVKWQSFVVENPIQGNEILVKALASDIQ